MTHHALVILILGLAMTFVGCDTTPTASSDDGAPSGEIKVDELKSESAAPRPPATTASAQPLDEKYRRRLIIQTLALPPRSPQLAVATASLDEPGIGDKLAAMWRANGFGIGSLPVHRVSLFTANLPRSYVSPLFRMNVASTYNPVTMVERLRGRRWVDYRHADGDTESVELVSGQCQLLTRLEAPIDNVGPLKLDLLPHHYNPATRLIPTEQHNRALDGTSFDDLRIYQPIEPDRVLVIWADTPPADDDKQADARQPQSTLDQPEKLADVMLRGKTGSRSVQWLVMIGLEQR